MTTAASTRYRKNLNRVFFILAQQRFKGGKGIFFLSHFVASHISLNLVGVK